MKKRCQNFTHFDLNTTLRFYIWKLVWYLYAYTQLFDYFLVNDISETEQNAT